MKKLYPFLFFLLCFHSVFGQMHLPCPSASIAPANSCSEACIYCSFAGMTGTTVGYITSTPTPIFTCGTIENDQWMGFVASSTSATFTATPFDCSNFNGIQIAIYEDCNSFPLTCNGGVSGGGDIPVSISVGLIPGNTYFLMIDGFAGDQCKFSLEINPTSAPLPIGGVKPIIGEQQVCPGASVKYSVPQVVGASAYRWNAPTGCLINGQVPPVTVSSNDGGNAVEVSWGLVGGEICVTAFNGCDQSMPVCKTVSNAPIITTLPPVTICFEELPYISPWGDTIHGGNMLTRVFTSYLGCDSVVRLPLIIRTPIITSQGVSILCYGDSLEICGQKFGSPGPYTKVCKGAAVNGCDSTVVGQILLFNPMAKIQSPKNYLCNGESITLQATGSQGFLRWRNEQGTLLGTSANLTISEAGTYFLEIIQSGGATICSGKDSIVIRKKADDKILSLSVPKIDNCHPQPVRVTTEICPAPKTWRWSGPNGFISDLPQPTLSVEGWYFVEAIFDDGTSVHDSILLENNGLIPPNFDVKASNPLTCCQPTTTLSVENAAVSDLKFQWSGPQNFSATTAEVDVSVPGEYCVTATDPQTNCSRMKCITLEDNNAIWGVSINAPLGDVLTCVRPSITLQGNSTLPNTTFQWSGPAGFTSNDANVVVLEPGVYTLLANDPVLCCEKMAVFTVLENKKTPQFQITGSTILTCDQRTTVLTPVGNNMVFTWLNTHIDPPPSGSVLIEKAGTYTVLATDLSNGCTATKSVMVVDSCTISVRPTPSASDNDLRIYPNVATDEVVVEALGTQFISKIRMLDANSRLVLEQDFVAEKFVRLPIAHFPAATYTILVQMPDGWRRKMLVKQ